MAIIDLLARTTVCSQLPRERLADLAASAIPSSAKRGQVLARAGDPLQELLIVQRGLVKLVRHTSRGLAICGLLGPGEAVDDISMICGTRCLADAIAASDSVGVLAIPRKALLSAFVDSPQTLFALASSAEGRMERLFEKIDVLSAGGVEARLATLLLKLNERFGDDFDDGTTQIPVPLSRRELAELVATSFETAIRILSRWEREQILETTRQGFTVRDMSRLAALAGASAVLAAE